VRFIWSTVGQVGSDNNEQCWLWSGVGWISVSDEELAYVRLAYLVPVSVGSYSHGFRLENVGLSLGYAYVLSGWVRQITNIVIWARC